MKKVIFILLVGSATLSSCENVRLKEQAATIANRDYTFCGYCGGWFVWVDSTMYRATVPASFEKEYNKVWIRFEPDERPGYKDTRWIKIKSIRAR